MAHSIVDRLNSLSTDTFFRGVFRGRRLNQPRRNFTSATARQLFNSFEPMEQSAQQAAPADFKASEVFFSAYNSAKLRVSGSIQSLLRGVASKIPSYPDLTAFRRHHESHANEGSGDTIAAKEEKEAYVEALSKALSQPLLMPYIERADRTEVQYATLLADLSNMAYEADKVDMEQLERHRLVFISNSSQPMLGPITREAHWDLVKAAHAAGMTSEQMTTQMRISKAAVHPSGAHPPMNQEGEYHAAASGERELSPGSPSRRSLSSGSEWSDGCDGLFTRGPLSPDIEYSILLGSMEEMLPEDSEYHQSQQHWTPSMILSTAQHASVQHLLGSMEDEEEARSALGEMEEISRTMTLNQSFVGGINSMASVDDFWPGDEATVDPKQPTAPRLPDRRGVATPAVRVSAAGETSPFGHGNAITLSLPSEDLEGLPGSPQSGQLLTQPEPPAAWFVADDPTTQVRYFVIQGSTSLDHWSINFKFDPVIFESPALGVRVHRGVYEAALRMYDDLAPLVKQHLASAGPNATVSLTGHSLGGSLASILMMLLVYRKVAESTQLSPSYTFGAPAVFCPLSCSGGADPQKGECDSNCRPVMEMLDIPDEMLVNVMMHKDIVPRAFVCDYTLVADLLKQWMPSFKDHSSLSNTHEHKMLYNFLGRVAVLRPDDSAHFVSNDNFHPMLPDGPGLYKLREPLPPKHIAHLSGSYDGLESMDVVYSDDPGGKPREAMTLHSALLRFMNYPHPLQTLSTYESYGPNGAISRFHNPDNYTKGLLGLPEHLEEEAAPRWDPINFDDLLEAATSASIAAVRRF